MIGVSGLIFISCLNLHASLVQAACETWDDVTADAITNEYLPPGNVAAANAYPLGFKALSVAYNQASPPCVKFRNAEGSGRHYQLLFEIDPAVGNLCIRDKDSGDAANCLSASTTGSQCNQVPSPNIKYEFTCSSCEETQINFWYKFQIEPEVNGTFDEYWCDYRNPVFPGSLKDTSQGEIPIPVPPTDGPGGGARELFNLFSFLCLFFICQLFYNIS